MNSDEIAEVRSRYILDSEEPAPFICKLLDELEATQRLLRQCKLLAMKDDNEESTVVEMHNVPLEDIPDFVNSRIADLECEAASVETLQARNAEIDALLEERNEADTHYLIQICYALGLRKAQSVPLALETIVGMQAELESLPKMADGTKITSDLVGREVWTWGFPGMCLSSFTVKQIRFDGEAWEFVGVDSRYIEQVAMYAGLCCLSEEAAEVAKAAKENKL